MALPIDIRQEAAFWGERFREHALMTATGLAGPNQVSVRTAAMKLAGAAPAFIAAGPNGVARLSTELSGLHRAILASFKPPSWPGFNFPSVLRHMIREQEWYLGLMDNRWSPSDLLCLAAMDKSEAAGVLAKMLDPSVEPLSRAAEARSEALKMLSARCRTESFVSLAPAVAAEIGGVVSLGGSPEVAMAEKAIPLRDILHEGAEGKHHMALIDKILQQTGA